MAKQTKRKTPDVLASTQAPALDFLTTVLRVIAPNRAARRIAGQIAFDRLNQVRETEAKRAAYPGRFGYDAAKPSRNHPMGGRVDIRTIDQLNQDALDTLRSQARHLEQNYDLGESVLHDLITNVIGKGIRTFPGLKDRNGRQLDDLNERLRRRFRDWARSPEVTGEHDWYATQRLMARTWFRDGEAFSQILEGNVRGLTHGSEVMLSLELIEADLVPHDLNDERRRIRQGVEKNTWGRPVAFHVYKEPPGEHFPFLPTGASTGVMSGRLSSALFDTKTIVANRMIHLKMCNRIRQTRGISLFATVFFRLMDLMDFEDSERIAARIAASFALAITNTDGASMAPSAASIREMPMVSGIIVDNLGAGEDVKSLSHDRPNNNIGEFRKSQLMAIAGGTRSRYSSIANDYGGTYSSQRQEMVEGAEGYAMIQSDFITRFVDPVWRRFIDMVQFQALEDFSLVDPNTLYECDHRGAGARYIDMKKEVEADEIAVKAGFKSRSHVIGERTGRDPHEVRAEIQAEREADQEAGLTFSSTATAAELGASGAGDENEAADDPDIDDTEESVNGRGRSSARRLNGTTH